MRAAAPLFRVICSSAVGEPPANPVPVIPAGSDASASAAGGGAVFDVLMQPVPGMQVESQCTVRAVSPTSEWSDDCRLSGCPAA